MHTPPTLTKTNAECNIRGKGNAKQNMRIKMTRQMTRHQRKRKHMGSPMGRPKGRIELLMRTEKSVKYRRPKQKAGIKHMAKTTGKGPTTLDTNKG